MYHYVWDIFHTDQRSEILITPVSNMLCLLDTNTHDSTISFPTPNQPKQTKPAYSSWLDSWVWVDLYDRSNYLEANFYLKFYELGII